jgi:hypothetical protein
MEIRRHTLSNDRRLLSSNRLNGVCYVVVVDNVIRQNKLRKPIPFISNKLVLDCDTRMDLGLDVHPRRVDDYPQWRIQHSASSWCICVYFLCQKQLWCMFCDSHIVIIFIVRAKTTVTSILSVFNFATSLLSFHWQNDVECDFTMNGLNGERNAGQTVNILWAYAAMKCTFGLFCSCLWCDFL